MTAELKLGIVVDRTQTGVRIKPVGGQSVLPMIKTDEAFQVGDKVAFCYFPDGYGLVFSVREVDRWQPKPSGATNDG